MGLFMLVNHKIPMTLMSEMKIAVRSLLDQPMEIKTFYTDNVIAGSGYLAPNKKNPHLETLGLYYDFGSSQAVETIYSQLGASPYQRLAREIANSIILYSIISFVHILLII